MTVKTLRISSHDAAAALYQLLTATESLSADDTLATREILDAQIAEPLRGIAESALGWVAAIEQAKGLEPETLEDVCFRAQKALRRALRELGLSGCDAEGARTRCGAATDRIRTALTAVLEAVGLLRPRSEGSAKVQAALSPELAEAQTYSVQPESGARLVIGGSRAKRLDPRERARRKQRLLHQVRLARRGLL